MAMTDFVEVREPVGIGHNRAPVKDMLSDAYEQLLTRADELIAASTRAPASIYNDEVQGKVGDLVKMIAAAIKKSESHRQSEKEPFLQAGREVDGFFRPVTDKLEREKKTLEGRIGVYLRAKAERERRAREETARLEREESDRRLREAQALESANRKAEADTALQQAAEADAASAKAEKAADAKPADMARTRGDLGSLSTLRTALEVEVTDYALVPLEAIRAYIPRDAIDKAVRAWARNGGREMPGCRIQEVQTAVVR